jgi:hypothetical protein
MNEFEEDLLSLIKRCEMFFSNHLFSLDHSDHNDYLSKFKKSYSYIAFVKKYSKFDINICPDITICPKCSYVLSKQEENTHIGITLSEEDGVQLLESLENDSYMSEKFKNALKKFIESINDDT